MQTPYQQQLHEAAAHLRTLLQGAPRNLDLGEDEVFNDVMRLAQQTAQGLVFWHNDRLEMRGGSQQKLHLVHLEKKIR